MTVSKPALATNGSHQDWIPLLEVAAREVFELMLNCRLTVAPKPFENVRGITSMVGLAGQLSGIFSVRCDEKSGKLIASKMLGVGPNDVSSELSDALGEVCNMIAGNFKNKIAGMGDGCMLSPPTVITGNDYDLHPLADSTTIAVSLLFEEIPVVISLHIHN